MYINKIWSMMDSAYIFQLSHEEAAHKRHWAINNASRPRLDINTFHILDGAWSKQARGGTQPSCPQQHNTAKNFDAADPGQNQFGDSYFPYLQRLLSKEIATLLDANYAEMIWKFIGHRPAKDMQGNVSSLQLYERWLPRGQPLSEIHFD
jgi:hypothetical protein